MERLGKVWRVHRCIHHKFIDVFHDCRHPQYTRVAFELIVIIVVSVSSVLLVDHPAKAVRPDVVELYQMTQSGYGEVALDLLGTEARSLGGWGPAPGDEAVFDPTIPWWTRAEVLTADLPPAECAIPKFSQFSQCEMIDRAKEHLVRFGPSTFSNQREDGTNEPRPVFDDLIATYIEEVGHSWQEYCYEAEGCGAGPRVQKTTWEDAVHWMPGREYQIKRYILNLDGSLIALSAKERGMLMGAVCDSDGYANPNGHDVPRYGSPPNWPHPEMWPVGNPDQAEFEAFCVARWNAG